MKEKKIKGNIYVCHTHYHVYVALLKEFALPKEEQKKATLVLSTMSADFSGLKERLEKTDVFKEVVFYDEKPYWYFDELMKYKKDYHNFLVNLVNRIVFTKKFARLQEAYVPVDFGEYQDVYVFCDSDPIGYYLNYKHIHYHSVEDGLNSLVHVDAARYDNRGNFKIKALLASVNLIFIQNGYSKYCDDVEVNQIEGIRYPLKKHKEVSREKLFQNLDQEAKNTIVEIFVAGKEKLFQQMKELAGRKNYLILTEPLCDLDTRERIFSDLVDQYKDEANICIKPHPRDELEYEPIFPELFIFEKKMPMEVLNCFGKLFFDKTISVLTDVKGIYFSKEAVRLGPDFLDQYEEPSIHRQNEQF